MFGIADNHEFLATIGIDKAPNRDAIIADLENIAQQFDSQHGMVPGSNGITAGAGGKVGNLAHVHPGAINTWPQQAREYMIQAAQKWAESGLINATKTGGEPIFSTAEKTVINFIPNTFYNALVQAEASAFSGVVGSVV